MSTRGGLRGRRVVVTRAPHQAGELARLLEDRGARVLYLPVIRIADPLDWAPLDDALRALASGRYTWVAFASANAVGKVMDRVDRLGLDGVALARARVAAVGPTTAAALRARGVEPDAVPAAFTAAALARSLGPGSGAVLLPRVEGAPRAPLVALRDRGWRPEQVVAYRNLPADPTPAVDDVRARRFDALTLASASAARGLVRLLGNPAELGLAPEQDSPCVVACIGPQTAEAAGRCGLRVDVVASEHSAAGLVAALDERFVRHPRMAP